MEFNPWNRLPQTPPFVLPDDASIVSAFNVRARDNHRVITDLLPEPHIGSFHAPVVLLNLNPGFSEEDYHVHARPDFQHRLLATIRGEPTPFPFYYLDPSQDGAGHHWWRRRLRPLIEATSNAAVAQNILCVEFFPYHSKQFGHGRLRLPSQRFAAALVRGALKRKALVVAMRGFRYWTAFIRELDTYGELVRLNSPQNVTISAGNCPAGFERIVDLVNSGTA